MKNCHTVQDGIDLLSWLPKNCDFLTEAVTLQSSYYDEDMIIESLSGDFFLMYGHVRKQFEILKKLRVLKHQDDHVPEIPMRLYPQYKG